MATVGFAAEQAGLTPDECLGTARCTPQQLPGQRLGFLFLSTSRACSALAPLSGSKQHSLVQGVRGPAHRQRDVVVRRAGRAGGQVQQRQRLAGRIGRQVRPVYWLGSRHGRRAQPSAARKHAQEVPGLDPALNA